MNLKALAEVLKLEVPDQVKKDKILRILSSDENTIVYLLRILDHERDANKELISDLNLELSRAHVHILSPKLMKKIFTLNNIELLYIKWKEKIKHCFNYFQ